MPIYDSVNGVARKVLKMYDSVEGVARQIVKSYESVNGVARLSFSSSTSLGSLEVGSVVPVRMNTRNEDYIVVQQGNPNTTKNVYDTSCDGTWLMSKNIYDLKEWDTDGVNYYEDSTIHAYLNEGIFTLFSSKVQDLIKQVRIPYVSDLGNLLTSGKGLKTKIFLLSVAELGLSSSGITQGEGITLSYFTDSYNAINDDIATWTRTPAKDNNTQAFIVHKSICASTSVKSSYGFRPTIILPSDVNTEELI